ncbi:putative restriction endonuclease [Pedobacter africanus]|uniref:Restriction endonuclease n=1 Tax=Pedobacter africanus TaxID=151894 RepID=A0ACC6KRV1_9SPHI|nr:YDG/SRA domain-containing protein [Pedobacter africanus]MDR6781922.1 putative restriction endonuclease [Pedobacter africanus]
MAEIQFGQIIGIGEGQIFKDRKALAAAGIHRPLQAGIDGNKKDGSSSIVLNGGYVDDEDLGNVIIYTGHGGNDPNTKRQVADQSWDSSGNRGLLISEMHGLPVRITRGAGHKSKYSPSNGYKYDGLYLVTQHFYEIGKDGFRICRFRLEKLSSISPLPLDINESLESYGASETSRIPTTILRIARDTKLSRKIKEVYDYTCQVCGIRISFNGIGYAEAAHIRPLGNPHNGKDLSNNLLCLCPNHHVMFDKGAFTINEDHSLSGVEGRLFIKPGRHAIDTENLVYHNKHIFNING